jgi:hypothetical protein
MLARWARSEVCFKLILYSPVVRRTLPPLLRTVQRLEAVFPCLPVLAVSLDFVLLEFPLVFFSYPVPPSQFIVGRKRFLGKSLQNNSFNNVFPHIGIGILLSRFGDVDVLPACARIAD